MLEGIGAQRVAELAHQRGGLDCVSGDVADHQSEATVGQGDGVVPVPSDADLAAAGHVAGREGDAGRLRHLVDEDAALERLDEPVLVLVGAGAAAHVEQADQVHSVAGGQLGRGHGQRSDLAGLVGNIDVGRPFASTGPERLSYQTLDGATSIRAAAGFAKRTIVPRSTMSVPTGWCSTIRCSSQCFRARRSGPALIRGAALRRPPVSRRGFRWHAGWVRAAGAGRVFGDRLVVGRAAHLEDRGAPPDARLELDVAEHG
jgi:hypothetical protein